MIPEPISMGLDSIYDRLLAVRCLLDSIPSESSGGHDRVEQLSYGLQALVRPLVDDLDDLRLQIHQCSVVRLVPADMEN